MNTTLLLSGGSSGSSGSGATKWLTNIASSLGIVGESDRNQCDTDSEEEKDIQSMELSASAKNLSLSSSPSQSSPPPTLKNSTTTTLENETLQEDEDVVKLTLHKDYNLTDYLSAYNKKNRFTPMHHLTIEMGWQPVKENYSKAKYLNNLIAQETSGQLRRGNQHYLSDDNDYGYFVSSDLIGPLSSNSGNNNSSNSLKTNNSSSSSSSSSNDVLVYEDADIDFFTVCKVYNPVGQLISCQISNPDFVYFLEDYEMRRQGKMSSSSSKSLLRRRDMKNKLTLPRDIPFNSFRMYSSNDRTVDQMVKDAMEHRHSGDEKKRRRKLIENDRLNVCLSQPPDSNTLSPLANSKVPSDYLPLEKAAHNEGIYYMLIYIYYPNIDRQLATVRTKLSNKSQRVTKRIPRSDKFVTRVYSNSSEDGKRELCRYTSSLRLPSDYFVNDVVKFRHCQLAGMLYYSSDKDCWNFRATNDFKPRPPTKLVIKVMEAIPERTSTSSNASSNVDSESDTATSTTTSNSSSTLGDYYCTVKYSDKTNHTEKLYKTAQPVFEDEFEYSLNPVYNVNSDESKISISLHQVTSLGLSHGTIGIAELPSLMEIFGNDNLYTFQVKQPLKQEQLQRQQQLLQQQQQQQDQSDDQTSTAYDSSGSSRSSTGSTRNRSSKQQKEQPPNKQQQQQQQQEKRKRRSKGGRSLKEVPELIHDKWYELTKSSSVVGKLHVKISLRWD